MTACKSHAALLIQCLEVLQTRALSLVSGKAEASFIKADSNLNLIIVFFSSPRIWRECSGVDHLISMWKFAFVDIEAVPGEGVVVHRLNVKPVIGILHACKLRISVAYNR